MSQPRILIVHPEESSLALLSSMLKSLGHVIDEAPNDRVAVKQLERGGIDMVLAGVDPSDPEALELLSCIRRKHRQVPAILLFSAPHPERTKEALRQGALSVLRYPVPATELRAAVTQALAAVQRPISDAPLFQHKSAAPSYHLAANGSGNSSTPQYMTNGGGHSSSPGNGLANGHGHGTASPAPAPLPSSSARPESAHRDLGIIGSDHCLRLAIDMAATIAPWRTPVLIIGEHGTGKALVARAIHSIGSRNDQPFVTVDCAALTEATNERERSSQSPGPSNGSRSEPSFDWAGKVAQAHGGTLFLNDVAALSDALQFQLLQVLQEREHEPRNGGGYSEVRVLMSASEHLASLVEQAKFRQDLYHRASVVCLKLPPLRHRGGDIEQLAEYFRARFSLEYGKNVIGFTRDALDILNKHDWPGNVRELEGVIQRGVALCQGTRITSGHISPSLCHSRSSRVNPLNPRSSVPLNIRPLKEALEEPEKRIIIQALQALNWNRQETARVLDINRTTLYKKMKKYGLLVDEPIWVN